MPEPTPGAHPGDTVAEVVAWVVGHLARYPDEIDDYTVEAILGRAHRRLAGRCQCDNENRCCRVPAHNHHVSPHRGCGLR